MAVRRAGMRPKCSEGNTKYPCPKEQGKKEPLLPWCLLTAAERLNLSFLQELLSSKHWEHRDTEAMGTWEGRWHQNTMLLLVLEEKLPLYRDS